jgi:hypothetical protein
MSSMQPGRACRRHPLWKNIIASSTASWTEPRNAAYRREGNGAAFPELCGAVV